MTQPERLAVARGDQPADLVLRGGRVVNVYSGEIHEADVAIADGIVVGLGDYHGREEEDLRGAFVLPGLLDAHVHIESSMLAPAEFARCVAPHGTTGAFVDPHEVANVRGGAGVEWMLGAARDLPVRLYVNVPSCVPASPLDEAGAVLDAAEVMRLLALDGVVGLAEMMNYPGVVYGDGEVLAKLAAAAGRPVDGHAPFLGGRQLCAYLLGGPDSDHECTNPAEALEKLRLGCYLLIREGSATRNLAGLLPVLSDDNARRVCLCCDDISAEDLLGAGHIDRIVREVIAAGVSPLRAVQMATLNTAERFGLSRRIGAIAPGRRADLCVVDDLASFVPRRVWSAGQLIAADGVALFDTPRWDDSPLRDSVHLAELGPATFDLPAPGGRVKVIEVNPTLLLTTATSAEPKARDGLIVADPERDLLLAACLERHHGRPDVGLGLVRGFGLTNGALASSVGHDSHHITAVGVSRAALARAVAAVAEAGGGLAVANDDGVLASLPLPLAGLMSDQPAAAVAHGLRAVQAAARSLGCALPDPFMTLSFISLSVIPELRLTPNGLVDVTRFERTALSADA